MRDFLIRTAQAVRTAWLMIGISFAMLAFAECSVRVVRRVSGADVHVVSPPPEYRGSNWYGEFTREYDETRPQRWLSYLYFGRLPSYHGRYVNIDSAGHRVTPQPSTPAEPLARVFFFGGSTMWGTEQRDEHTIAAEASRRLQLLAGPGARIEVTNYGESGYIFTQDVINLILQLRAGLRPDVVVFYDGINDVYATVQSGAAGIPQNESKRAAEFALGRTLDRTGFARGLRKDARALGVLTISAFEQLALVDWLQSLMPKRPGPPLMSADSATRSTARVYVEEVRMVEALSKAYGFTPIYVWQPTVHGTSKPPSAYEQRIMNSIRNDPFQARLKEIYVAIPPLLSAAVGPIAGSRFIDATPLFSGDTSTVFVDRIGHNAESSVPAIVDGFWPALQAAVANRHRP